MEGTTYKEIFWSLNYKDRKEIIGCKGWAQEKILSAKLYDGILWIMGMFSIHIVVIVK